MSQIKTIPRDYQKAIVESAVLKNTLVVLPTGLGKTLIALLVAEHRMNEFPGEKILILAPTKPLAEQHYNSFKKELPELFAEIILFTGEVPAEKRKKLWDSADIIFSTPQCIANDLDKRKYTLASTSLLVIDEAHRSLKNYDYTKIARYYQNQAQHQRLLALTASPGSEIDKVRQICKNLNIEALEIRSRESEDVKPHVQEIEFSKIEIDYPAELKEIRELMKRLYERKVEELRSRNVLFGPANKITLLQLQTKLIQRMHLKEGTVFAAVSACAQAIKLSHAIELIETQTVTGFLTYLDTIIEQAREKKSRGVQILAGSPEFNAARIAAQAILTKKGEHPKIASLVDLVNKEIQNHGKNIIIFSQFRETAHKIVDSLSSSSSVRAKVFIGQASKKTSAGLSQKEQKEIIQQFRDGEINVLCATSIGEEGLDIPEVGAVFFYEPIPSVIRKIQRAGRTARHSSGRLYVLVTKDTRDEAYYYASAAKEKKMYKTIETMKSSMNLQEKLDSFI